MIWSMDMESYMIKKEIWLKKDTGEMIKWVYDKIGKTWFIIIFLIIRNNWQMKYELNSFDVVTRVRPVINSSAQTIQIDMS